MLNLIKGLCALPGVSGNEDEVREFILNRVKNHADDVSVDAMGNVIVFKKGAGTPDKKLMLCAHMDEVGVIITNILDDGYIKFATVGGVDKRVVFGKSVELGKKRVFGIIGNRPVHLLKGKEREKAVDIQDMYIDIGAKNRLEAEKLVALGDTGVFSGDAAEFGDGFLKARAIDDRFGCAVLLKLIESELPVDCHFAFTVQEEVGARGAHAASYRTDPEIAMMVETTTAADIPSVADEKKVCRVGGGAVIPFMDGGAIYDRGLYKLLTALADRHSIPWQTKTRIAGGTDAQVIQRSRAGVRVAAVSAPVRNIHSPSCVGAMADFEAVYKLMRMFLREAGEGRV